MSASPLEEKEGSIDSKQVENDLEVVPTSSDVSLELTAEEHRRLKSIVSWRILPYFSLLYVLSFLDRVNIGQARLAGLEKDLRLHGQQYDIALTVFFVAYIVVDVPSNLALKMFKPHRWITFLMVSWSIVMVLMGTVSNFGGLVAARFMLGVFEGGLFPGLNFVLTTWFSRTEQNSAISMFFAGSTLAGAFGGILAYGIRHMDGIGGKGGWAWIFILEGLVTFLFAIPAWFMIPDFPEDNRVLRGVDQRRWIQHLARSQGITNTPIPYSSRQLMKALKDWKIYVYSLSFLAIGQPFYSLSLFTPSIIAALGFKNADANLLSVPPFAFAFLTTVGVGFFSDRIMHRGAIILVCITVSMVGYTIQLCDVSPGVKYFGVFLCVGGICPSSATTISWIGNNVGPIYTRAAAIGVLFAAGNMAGIIASNVYPASTAPRYIEGHTISLSFAFLALVCTAVLMFALSCENARRDALYGEVAADGSDVSVGEVLGEKEKAWGLEGMSRLEIIELGDNHPGFRYIV